MNQDTHTGDVATIDHSAKTGGAWRWPLRTDNGLDGLVLRVLLAVVMFPHGAQKVFGWFGGGGFSATLQSFTEKMNIPWPLALAAILSESLGVLGLFLGFVTRLWALALGTTMVVAALMVHWKHGFLMNWFGQKDGEGFEYHILALAIALALVIRGGGRWSVDRMLTAPKR